MHARSCGTGAGSVECVASEAEFLAEDFPDEKRVVFEVPFPEAPGFLEGAIQPFESAALDPTRGLLHAAGMEIEGGTDAEQDFGIEFLAVTRDEPLLFWGAEADPEEVGFEGGDLACQSGVLLGGQWTEGWGVGSDDADAGVTGFQFLFELLGNAGVAAIEKMSVTAGAGPFEDMLHQFGAVHAAHGFVTGQASHPDHGHAVGSGEERAVVDLAEGVVGLGFHDAMNAGDADVAALAGVEGIGERGDGGLKIEDTDSDAEDIDTRRHRSALEGRVDGEEGGVKAGVAERRVEFAVAIDGDCVLESGVHQHMKPRSLFRQFALMAAASLLVLAARAELIDQLAIQTWTLRNMNFDQVVEFAKKHGIKELQLIPNHVDYTKESQEQIAAKKAKLEANGLHAYTFGVAGTSLDKETNRKLFVFAKFMGFKLVVVEPPDFKIWDNLEELAKEYDIQVAVHNHGIRSLYGNPAVVKSILKHRDARLGVCMDAGWITDAGFDAAKIFKEYEGRVFDIHLKDKKVEHTQGGSVSMDTHIGEGHTNYKELIKVLRSSNYKGKLAIETDSKDFAAMPDEFVSKAKEFIRNAGQ